MENLIILLPYFEDMKVVVEKFTKVFFGFIAQIAQNNHIQVDLLLNSPIPPKKTCQKGPRQHQRLMYAHRTVISR